LPILGGYESKQGANYEGVKKTEGARRSAIVLRNFVYGSGSFRYKGRCVAEWGVHSKT